VDEKKLLDIAVSYLDNPSNIEALQKKITDLNQDERNVLAQYL
jgi:hypothetical protein